jgi:hypothetical protein
LLSPVFGATSWTCIIPLFLLPRVVPLLALWRVGMPLCVGERGRRR